MSTWQVFYEKLQPQITVNYNAVGSGAGVTDFTVDGLGNFGESDAPMTAAQYALVVPTGTVVLTIPISASAVVPAYNLKLVNGSLCQNGLIFSGQVLGQIFCGQITTWNDPAIKALNPNLASQLPSTTITCVHRQDSSGTMFAFTDFLEDTSPEWQSVVGQASTSTTIWPALSGEVTAPKNAGVAAAIASANGAIGPLEISYILENPGETSEYYGAVVNGAGNAILASAANNDANIAATLQAGAAAGLPVGSASWSSVSIIDNTYKDTTDTGIYPIVTMTYALVNQVQTNQAQGAALRQLPLMDRELRSIIRKK